jgi:hypothetical protein
MSGAPRRCGLSGWQLCKKIYQNIPYVVGHNDGFDAFGPNAVVVRTELYRPPARGHWVFHSCRVLATWCSAAHIVSPNFLLC